MHTLDRYFTSVTGNDLTDEIAEGLCTVIRNGGRAVKNPADYDAMSEIMWSAAVSHNGLTGLGGARILRATSLGTLSVPLRQGARATLSALWESWSRYVLP